MKQTLVSAFMPLEIEYNIQIFFRTCWLCFSNRETTTADNDSLRKINTLLSENNYLRLPLHCFLPVSIIICIGVYNFRKKCAENLSVASKYQTLCSWTFFQNVQKKFSNCWHFLILKFKPLI